MYTNAVLKYHSRCVLVTSIGAYFIDSGLDRTVTVI